MCTSFSWDWIDTRWTSLDAQNQCGWGEKSPLVWTRPHLIQPPCLNRHWLKQCSKAMAIKNWLLTSPLQTTIDTHYQCRLPFPLLIVLRRTSPGPQAQDCCPQSTADIFDNLYRSSLVGSSVHTWRNIKVNIYSQTSLSSLSTTVQI